MGPAAVAVDAEGVEIPVPQWSEFFGDGSGQGWYSGGGGAAAGAEAEGGAAGGFVEDSVARRYGFGFAALEDGSAVAGGGGTYSGGGGGGSGMGGYGDGSSVPGPNGLLPPRDVLENPAAMLRYLGSVTDRLAEAMTRMAVASTTAREGPRRQGDGAIAVDTQGALALAGRESQAIAMQHTLRDAVRALGITAADGSLGSDEAAALREALFGLVGDVGRQVRPSLLHACALWRHPSRTTPPPPARRSRRCWKVPD